MGRIVLTITARPSDKNQQPVHWLVLSEQTIDQCLSKVCLFLKMYEPRHVISDNVAF